MAELNEETIGALFDEIRKQGFKIAVEAQWRVLWNVRFKKRLIRRRSGWRIMYVRV